MSAECAFCFGNFKIQGTTRTRVPLFSSTNNKEIITLVKGRSLSTVTLSVLLSHIGIHLQKDTFAVSRRSVCKKCARKVTSTYNTFMEICEVVKKNGSLYSNVGTPGTPETPPSSPNARIRKRQQFFSPTGLSPHAKTTTRPRASSQIARKRLNLSSAASVRDNVTEQDEQDAIANLMNLPVTEDGTQSSPIVKVRQSHYKLFRY